MNAGKNDNELVASVYCLTDQTNVVASFTRLDFTNYKTPTIFPDR